MALFRRVRAAVLLVNFAVLSAFVALATLQFGSINLALVRQRLGMLAGQSVAPFEVVVRIGLLISCASLLALTLDQHGALIHDPGAMSMVRSDAATASAAAAPRGSPTAR